jgi:hypothetical protein
MAGRYVRIPYDQRLKFPAHCPFTNQPKTSGHITVSNCLPERVLPLPFLRHLCWGRKAKCRFPSSTGRGVAVAIFGALALICLGVFLVALALSRLGGVASTDSPSVETIAWAGLGIAFLCRMVQTWLLWPVRIVHAGENTMEICFSDVAYAEEFAILNAVICGPKPSHRKKHKPAG